MIEVMSYSNQTLLLAASFLLLLLNSGPRYLEIDFKPGFALAIHADAGESPLFEIVFNDAGPERCAALGDREPAAKAN